MKVPLPLGLCVISVENALVVVLNSGDPVSLCADAAARWHGSWLDALGIPHERDGFVWRALAQPPRIYFAGMALRPDADPDALAELPGSVCDSWQTLDLTPHGRRVWRREPWFYRPPGPITEAPPPELELVAVSTPEEVYEFEAVSVRGFGGEDDSVPPGTYHPPSVLADEAMHMFTGRVEGAPVAAATGYRTEHVVGVFGVATVASARNRGYGTALTSAALLAETELPAILAPSLEGINMYRRLGFTPVGELSIWSTAGPDR
jgi:hypothetical protein